MMPRQGTALGEPAVILDGTPRDASTLMASHWSRRCLAVPAGQASPSAMPPTDAEANVHHRPGLARSAPSWMRRSPPGGQAPAATSPRVARRRMERDRLVTLAIVGLLAVLVVSRCQASRYTRGARCFWSLP